jgi:hypothetical protein
MILGLVAILCSYDWATILYLEAMVFVSSSLELSRQFTNSCCRILNISVHDLMVSMLLGEVSERISVFWLELSPDALVAFHGAMVSGLGTLLSITGKAQNSLSRKLVSQ